MYGSMRLQRATRQKSIHLKKLFFSFRSWFVDVGRPLQADGCFFNLDITAGTGFNHDGSIIVHFVDHSMDAGNGHHFIAFLQVVDELFLLFGFFGLRADHEHPEYEHH